jgi:hypothetical protein
VLLIRYLLVQGHCGFENPWEFFLSFKNYETNVNWFTNEAAVNLRVQRRSMQTVDGKSPFLYFDGATMMSYKYPSKQSEVVFCRRQPTPEGCTGGRGFDLDRINIPISALEVKQSSLGEHAGRGVFAKIDIPELSYVGLEELIHIFHMDPSTYALASSWCRTDDKCHWTYTHVEGETMESYIHGYGHSFSNHVSDYFGFPSSAVASFSHFLTLSFCIVLYRAESRSTRTPLPIHLLIMAVLGRTMWATICK